MAARDRWKEGRDKRERGRFLALPAAVLTSAAYLSLSPHGIKLLIDLGVQYNGSNNGDLSAAWKLMRPRGWRSEETLAKAKRELLQTQLIVETRQRLAAESSEPLRPHVLCSRLLRREARYRACRVSVRRLEADG